MCYALILSTTSNEDLSKFNSDAVRFEANIPDHLPASRLLYSHKWYVGSRTGCSCSFRHLYGPEFEFGIPEDWFPEEFFIEATLIFIRLVRSLIASGKKVDCVDLWDGSDAQQGVDMPRLPVNLNEIRDEEFRFFENHHFDFVLE